jgi:hypothetical protein
MEVAESRWQGHNPLVTESNVRALDLANGGGARFAGVAPEFRPAAANEAGQAFRGIPSMMVNGQPGAPYQPNESPNAPRRGLLRLFGRE